jgi:hypothetical protein
VGHAVFGHRGNLSKEPTDFGSAPIRR